MSNQAEDLPTYKCTICGNDHDAGMHCGRHILALRGMIGLYAETLEKMNDADTKEEMREIYTLLVFGTLRGDFLAACQMMKADAGVDKD